MWAWRIYNLIATVIDMKPKKKREKKYRPKPIKAPGIRLSEKDAESLAFRAHMSACALDTEQGLTQFIDIICKTTISMTTAGTMDLHAERILRTATKHLDAIMETNKVTEAQEKYLQRVAGFVDDWLCEGRIRYSDLAFAKTAMRNIDAKIIKNSVDSELLGD